MAESGWKRGGGPAKITTLAHPGQGAGPPAPLPLHAASPGCWHSPAHATHFWLWPALINIFNYRMNMLTCSAYRACETEECASADITVKFLEDVGAR